MLIKYVLITTAMLVSVPHPLSAIQLYDPRSSFWTLKRYSQWPEALNCAALTPSLVRADTRETVTRCIAAQGYIASNIYSGVVLRKQLFLEELKYSLNSISVILRQAPAPLVICALQNMYKTSQFFLTVYNLTTQLFVLSQFTSK